MKVRKIAHYVPVTDIGYNAFHIFGRTASPEEMAEYEALRERRKAQTAEWMVHVHAVDDPVALAVMDLHQRDGHFCTAEEDTGWPCMTVRTVMEYLGYPAPDWVEL